MEELYTNSFQKKLVQFALRVQKLFFYRVIQRSVLTIFPFVLIGSFAKTIQLIFLTKDGLLSGLLDFVPDNIYFAINDFFSVISNMSVGFVSVIAVYASAKYTAKHFNRDDQLAGITGSIALFIVT